MKILLLAPQPFYQERGTPIAIKLLLDIFAQRGDQVDVITFHEGEPVALRGVTIHRTPALPGLHGIRPGFSLKKLICDALLLPQAIFMAARGNYDYVHAVEEAAFIALLLKVLFRLPYVYDMDSSLSDQLTGKIGAFKPLLPLFRWLECRVIRHASAVVPVCDALRDDAERAGAKKITVLYDVPLPAAAESGRVEDLRARFAINGLLALYVGNLEAYQGIDLLLASMKLVAGLDLVIIGGKPQDIAKYQHLSRELGIAERAHFLGAQPVARLAAYLAQADILVSPRVQGSNTPMKLYSYLASGKPIVATNLWTHAQVLSSNTALLVEPTPRAFGNGLLRLALRPELRAQLGAAGKRLIETKYNYDTFYRAFTDLLSEIEKGAA